MIPVILESPYAATTEHTLEDHRQYHAECMIDSLSRGESPISSHGTWAFSNILDDSIPSDRQLGIKAGFAWLKLVSHIVMYCDLGLSIGMLRAEQAAKDAGRKVVYRFIRARGSDISGAEKAVRGG